MSDTYEDEFFLTSLPFDAAVAEARISQLEETLAKTRAELALVLEERDAALLEVDRLLAGLS